MDVSRANRGGSPSMVDPHYGQSPYTQQWNFNLQRRLTKTTMLDLGYVGNKSTGLRNEALARLNQLPASVLTDYGARLTTMLKDVVLGLQEAEALGVPMWVHQQVGQLWRFGEQQGLGQADFTALIRILEGWAGVEVRSRKP